MKWRINGRFIIPAALVYLELCLKAFAKLQNPFLGVVIVALGLGIILEKICCLAGPKWAYRARFIAVELSIIFFGVEYFMDNSYRVFMDFKTMIGGAGGVAAEFGDAVGSVLKSGFLIIIIFHLPLWLMLYFRRNLVFTGRENKITMAGYAVLGLVIMGLGTHMLISDGEMRQNYTYGYSYDNAVRSFGLITAAKLDIKYGITGVPSMTAADMADRTVASGTVTQSAPSFFGLNVQNVDLDVLIGSSSGNIQKGHQYVKSQKASNKNQYTGLFKGKNLIFITAEAFSAEVISPELTPTLYRMANKGIQFTDYYQPAWGGSTSTGEYSNIFGVVPVNGVSSIQDTIGRDNYTTIGSRLKALGYWSCAYHNGYATYYDRDKTHTGFGYDNYIAKGTGLSEALDGVWPESDLKMMEGTLSTYIDKQPFSVYYMTVSGHCNYAWSANAMSKKNKDAVAGLDKSEHVKGYIAANLELEYAMAYLIEQLEAAGIADDTVIVMGTDHYPYGLEKSSAWGTTEDYLADLYGYSYKTVDERDHSRLIIWSGCLEDMDPIVVDTPTYSLDILPTLCNLFGVDFDSRILVGRDVFSTKEPLVLWTNGTWLTDKGFYNSSTGKFTAAEGAGEVSKDYISSIKSLVRGKIEFSRYVLNDDYYAYFK